MIRLVGVGGRIEGVPLFRGLKTRARAFNLTRMNVVWVLAIDPVLDERSK